VTLDEGGGMAALAVILLPALGTYDGRLVLVTEPAISCTVSAHVSTSTDIHTTA